MSKNQLKAGFWENEEYKIINQKLLPSQIIFEKMETVFDVKDAIFEMKLRGAPLIGASASAGMALSVKEWKEVSLEEFNKYYQMLLATRPTAINLKNVLDETKIIFEKNKNKTKDELYEILKEFSKTVHKRDLERNLKMGKNGVNYIKSLFGEKKLSVLTHCNSGALATCGHGTALGVIFSLFEAGMIEQVWVDETRPYLQGSRLTAFELSQAEIPHKIITDSTAGFLMSQGKVDFVVLGADSMAKNGDFANKIGTLSLAVNCNYFKIPFMTALPFETINKNIESGKEIVVEERSDKELLIFNNLSIAPQNSKGLHLGFDITPHSLLQAVITEYEVIEKPNAEKITSFIKKYEEL